MSSIPPQRILRERPPSASRRVPRPASEARAREITADVWSLQIPLCYLSVGSVNAYLLRSDEGWIVWDCGSMLAPGWAAMSLALGQAGVGPDEVSLLIVSHAHTDHRGLAAEFVERTGARLATSVGPHPLIDVIRDPGIPLEIRRERARREGVPELAIDGIVDELPGADTWYPEATPDAELSPGTTVNSRTGEWLVIDLPGHSADQIGLFNERRRLLISADLALPAAPAYLEYGTRPDPHAGQLASLDRAIALNPEVLLPGHGRPLPGATAVLGQCRRRVQERAELIAAEIEGPGVTGWEVAAALTPADALTDGYQRSLSEALSVLEHLELTGRARSVIDAERRRIWLTAD